MSTGVIAVKNNLRNTKPVEHRTDRGIAIFYLRAEEESS